MANEQNLKPFTSEQNREEAVKNGRKGGKASGQAKRERKTIQTILSDYLDSDVKTQKALAKVAASVGIKGTQTVKELVTAVCIINTLKKGDVDKLQKLCELLGEDNNIQKLEDISEAEADVFGTD
jgi:hypothetical protein